MDASLIDLNSANIYRFGKFYETPLLIQSIVMIFTMLFMLEVCIRLRKEHPLVSNLKKSFTGKVLARFAIKL